MAPFQEEVTYTPAGLDPVDLFGVFDRRTISVPVGDTEVLEMQTTLRIRLLDLPALPEEGDQVILRDTEYTVAEMHEVGQGDAILTLETPTPPPEEEEEPTP
jgi:hypothetical protein